MIKQLYELSHRETSSHIHQDDAHILHTKTIQKYKKRRNYHPTKPVIYLF